MRYVAMLLMIPILIAGPALASSTASWKALDRKSAKACIAESGLRQANVGPATRFSDRVMIDVRTVEGRYRQPHMKGVEAKMLCAYNRKSGRVEVQELK